MSVWDFAFAADPVQISTATPPSSATLTHLLWTENDRRDATVILQLDNLLWREQRTLPDPQLRERLADDLCRFCGRESETFRFGESTRVCARCVQAVRILLRPELGLSPSGSLYCVPGPDGENSLVPYEQAIEYMKKLGPPGT